MRTTLIPLLALASGCWHTELTELPAGRVDFDPVAGAPAGWVVEGYDLPITCPAGQDSILYAVVPEIVSTEPLPAAIVFHSGAFDYVRGPTAEDPLAGPHLQPESRLTREWAQRRAFTTLGMYDDDDRFEQHAGALPAALVEQGLVLLVPTNCWGDHWHNQQGQADNDFAADLYTRNGRAMAEWAWRVAAEEGFAASSGVDLPVSLDPDRIYTIGLGEGGRAVGELIHAGYAPASSIVDSVADDLNAYYAEPELYDEVITGLDRIFPEEGPSPSSLGRASLPPRLVYLYSSQDAQIPATAHSHILGILGSMPDAWVNDTTGVQHVVSGADLPLSRDAVAYMLAQ